MVDDRTMSRSVTEGARSVAPKLASPLSHTTESRRNNRLIFAAEILEVSDDLGGPLGSAPVCQIRQSFGSRLTTDPR